MLRRAFVLLLGPALLAGCVSEYQPSYSSSPIGLGHRAPHPTAPRGGPVAILLPLTGSLSNIGQPMLQAAQLALAGPDAPHLLVKDTGGNPQAAAAAAHAAIAQGAGLILGPLTAAETAAVAPIARSAGVAVLAFTNDPTQEQPGVWTLGITPGQQVRRLMAAAQAKGRTQSAALLPDNQFGRAMAKALTETTASLSLPAPNVMFHQPGMASIETTTRELADYSGRRGPIDARIRRARALHTRQGRREALALERTPIPPPPFNVLLLADTGEGLGEVASMLAYYDVGGPEVQIIGPVLWAAPSSGSSQVPGAWYAAPDTSDRATFVQVFSSKYGSPPPLLADLAFDAASIARVLAQRQGYSAAALTQPAGFVGTDGWMALLPDGRVRRGLAVFRVEHGGPKMVEPAPQSAAGSGA